MWEYKDATDEQLAEASAKHIMSYLSGETKEPIDRHFELQCIADCFLAIGEQFNMITDDYLKLVNYCSSYVVNDKENQECRKILKHVLFAASSSKEDTDNVVFLKAALLRSPEYLLTLRRSESLLTHSAQLYTDDYQSLMNTEIEGILENGCDEIKNLFEDGALCDDLASYVVDSSDSQIHSLIEQDKYVDAFETLVSSDPKSAKQFLWDHSDSVASLDFANDVAVENFNSDLEYFGIPLDGGFVEFASGIGWRNRSGTKLFDLDFDFKTDAENLLYNMRSCDSDRTTIVKYRVGEPFLTATEYSHDAPTGTSMTIIPEAWLDDALKYKEIRQAFENNEILRDIISVKDLQANLEEKSRKDPMAAMFKQAVKAELDESYYSMVDYYNNKGFEDLVYNAGLRMADYPNALKQPKEVISAIYDMVPKETFEKADWNIKESFERDFKDRVAKNKRYQNASAR